MQRTVTDQDAIDQADYEVLSPVKPDIVDVVGIARRSWLLIAISAVAGLIVAGFIVTLMPPTFKAQARLIFDDSLNRFMRSNKLVDGLALSTDGWAQSRVIASEEIIARVVQSLKLGGKKESHDAPDTETLSYRIREWVRTAKSKLKTELGLEPQLDLGDMDPQKRAIAAILDDLYVAPDSHNIIGIQFSSKNPERAALVANEIARSYISRNIEKRRNSVSLANSLIERRLKKLKQQAAEAERSLLEYKLANNLLGSGRKSPSADQLSALSSHLTGARIAMVEAKATRDSVGVSGGNGKLITDRRSGDTPIPRLRSQYLDLSVKIKDIEQRVGKGHLAVTRLTKRKEDLLAAIDLERGRISELFKSDYQLAKARYEGLASAVTEVINEETSSSKVRGRVRELATAAETLRDLHNSVLQQYSQVTKIETQAPAFPDARIITRASVPTRSESTKKRMLFLGAGSIFGLLLGTAIVFGREFPFGVFRTPGQVNRATGLSCFVLPLVKRKWRMRKARLEEYILDEPFSRFSETLRSVWVAVQASRRDDNSKVYCVASSNPGEGKTTIATNLAAHVETRVGMRVLLIDADLHLQTLTRRLAPKAHAGLMDALEDPDSLQSFVQKTDRFAYDLLPCPMQKRCPNAAELLGSYRMGKLLDEARRHYDLIILEAPPAAAVNDLKMLAQFCDGFIFVVAWGKTNQRLILEVFSEMPDLLDRSVCTVLNKANPKALKSIEYFKRDSFDQYYLS